MAITVSTVHPNVTYLLRTDGESGFVLLTANKYTGEVASNILPPEVSAMLTGRLQTLMESAPILIDFDAAFAGAVRSLFTVRSLEGVELTNPGHIEVTFPHSTSSPADEYAQGRSGGGTGICHVSMEGTTAVALVESVIPIVACTLTWTPGATAPGGLTEIVGPAAQRPTDGRILQIATNTSGAVTPVRTFLYEADGMSMSEQANLPGPGTGAADTNIIGLDDGRFLVVGGRYFTPLTTTFISSSSGPITWTAGPALPFGLFNVRLIGLASGDVLRIGGQRSNVLSSNSIQFFNKTAPAGSWLPRSPYPHNVTFPMVVRLGDGRLFAAGGYDVADGHIFSDAWIYNPTLDEWTECAEMNGPRQNFGMAVLPDGRVMVAGGSSSDGMLDSSEIFDPILNTWTPAGALPGGPRECINPFLPGGGAYVLSDGNFYFPAGPGDSGPTDKVDFYSPAANTWVAAAPTSEAYGFGALSFVLAPCTLLVAATVNFGASFSVERSTAP